jgi:misacylated tRNA(Ala) deacylase
LTEALYHFNSYMNEFEAVVIDTIDKGVVLDRSAFYPGGGGQPNDFGTLVDKTTTYQVTKVGRRDGKIVHELDQNPPPMNTQIKGVVDWDRRYKLMRTHTALHILCGVVWRDYGALVTGGDMQPLKARMDFELEHMTTDFAKEIEEKVNIEIVAARPVAIRVLTRDEAMDTPDLIRTKINLLPAGIQDVRVVDIENLDMQADGGTHVADTKEVGYIRVVGHESKGRINKRLRIEIE